MLGQCSTTRLYAFKHFYFNSRRQDALLKNSVLKLYNYNMHQPSYSLVFKAEPNTSSVKVASQNQPEKPILK